MMSADFPSVLAEENPFIPVTEGYLRYYASGSSHTARAKKLDIAAFTKFLCRHVKAASPLKLRMRHFDHSAIQLFVEACLERGESPATVARRLATLKHLGRTLADRVAGFVNPASAVKSPRALEVQPKSLAPIEIEDVVGRAQERRGEKKSFIRVRNETIVRMLIDTGLRADEIRLLKRGQIEDSLEWISAVRTKGKKYRNVYLSSRFRKFLREYLRVRTTELKRFFPKISERVDAALPLFISNYNADPLQPETFRMGAKSLWRAVRECSVKTKLHPHLLRHSFAVDLLNNSNDVRLVSQALGHSDVRVTMRYTQRRDHEVAEAVERARKKQK